jgi:hypothetical protein
LVNFEENCETETNSWVISIYRGANAVPVGLAQTP